MLSAHRFRLLVTALALLAATGASAGDPLLEAKKTVHPVEAIRAAKDAEVHVVGVYEPAVGGFGRIDVRDWPGLVKALRAGRGVAGRVRDLLPDLAREAIGHDSAVNKLDDPGSSEAALL